MGFLCAEEWTPIAELEIGTSGWAVTDVQVVVHAVFVTITAVCDACSSPSADRNTEVPGVLTAGALVVLGTFGVVGIMLLTVSSAIKEVGRALMVPKDLIEVGAAEQLVSVTVVLSVMVTIDTEVEMFEGSPRLIVMEPVEDGKTATEIPVTGAVNVARPGVTLKWPAIMLRRVRSPRWAGRLWASPWLAARTELCLSVREFVIKYSYGLNLQSKLRGSQKKMDHIHVDVR